jgi:hypothetical protein
MDGMGDEDTYHHLICVFILGFYVLYDIRIIIQITKPCIVVFDRDVVQHEAGLDDFGNRRIRTLDRKSRIGGCVLEALLMDSDSGF